MGQNDLPLGEDGSLVDRTDGLGTVYFIYLTLYLLPFTILALVLSLLFPRLSSWVLPLGFGLPALAITLSTLVTLLVKARKGGAIIGTVVLPLIWVLGSLLIPSVSGKGIFLLIGLSLSGVAYFLCLFVISGFLLPFPPPDTGTTRGDRLRQRLRNHQTVFKILLDYVGGTNYPCWVITDEPREEDKVEERVRGDPLAPFAFGNGLILSDCDHAVAVSDGIKFKGVHGPGLIFTGFAERPMRTLDLRPQPRAFTVQGLTRDGIQVKVLASTPFQIDRGEQQLEPGKPFPYRKSAAFRAVHAQMMELPEKPDHPQHSWDELPKLIGTRILQDILSRYRFDELYEYGLDEELPRVRIAREFRQRLKAELEPLGIQLIGGGISNLLPVKDELLKERIRHWQADWVRRILARQAEGQKERLWRIEQARAEAQANLILTLGERLAELERPGAPIPPHRIITQFLQILEEMTQQPMLRRYLPRETPEELRRLGRMAE